MSHLAQKTNTLIRYQKTDKTDRFIAHRGLELTNNFDTKAEIFEQQQNDLEKSHNRSSHSEDSQNENQSNSQGDENSKMYTTLLQNQVLGIKNPHLIQGGSLNDEFMDS